MSDAHSRGVTKHRLKAENTLENGFWDDYFVEHEYYEGDSAPAGPYPDDKGRMKGEFDVLLVNYDEQVAYYVEVKSSRKDFYKAGEQLDRAKEHFSPDWDVIGQKWLED